MQFQVVIISDCMCVGNGFKSKVPAFNFKEFFHINRKLINKKAVEKTQNLR